MCSCTKIYKLYIEGKETTIDKNGVFIYFIFLNSKQPQQQEQKKITYLVSNGSYQ